MGRLLEVLILGLDLMALLCEGAQGLPDGYNISISSDVSVPNGLCVIIPCSFTYSVVSEDDNAAKLYGYWYSEDSRYSPVATNKGDEEIQYDAMGRFHLSKELEQGNCSLVINNTKKFDAKTYFFRMVKGSTKYSYRNNDVHVTLTESPEMQIPQALQEGHPVNINCTAPRSCSWEPPQVTWSGFSQNDTAGTVHLLPDHVYTSVLNFTPSAADHGKSVTCRVSYGAESSVAIQKTTHLNVHYLPQRFQFVTKIWRKNGSHETNDSISQVQLYEGDILKVTCNAEGNPTVNSLTWEQETQTSKSLSALNNPLYLYSVKLKDKGEYKCQANNTMGSAEATFYVFVTYGPKPCNQEDSSCWREGEDLRCNCSICSYPPPQIQWQVDGKTLEGNASEGNLGTTSWEEKEKTTSVLRLTGNAISNPRIVCHGSNSYGSHSETFYLFTVEEGPSANLNIISGVIGAVIMFIVFITITGIVLGTCKRCRKVRKNVTGAESSPNHSTLVHSKIPQDIKGSKVPIQNPEEAQDYSQVLEKTTEFPDMDMKDPEELHYASIDFSVLKLSVQVMPEESSIEYTEIKTT